MSYSKLLCTRKWIIVGEMWRRWFEEITLLCMVVGLLLTTGLVDRQRFLRWRGVGLLKVPEPCPQITRLEMYTNCARIFIVYLYSTCWERLAWKKW